MEIIEKDLSFKIAGCCFKVHKKLGRFCSERQYSDELEKQFESNNISYKRECEIKSLNNESPAGNRVDFVIEDRLPVDIKAKKFITKEDYYQMLRYLYGLDVKLGMIVNFRSTFIKPKRVINDKFDLCH